MALGVGGVTCERGWVLWFGRVGGWVGGRLVVVRLSVCARLGACASTCMGLGTRGVGMLVFVFASAFARVCVRVHLLQAHSPKAYGQMRRYVGNVEFALMSRAAAGVSAVAALGARAHAF